MTITESWTAMEDDLLGETDYTEEPQPIPDLAEADYTLRRIARIRRIRDNELAGVDTEIERLREWRRAREEHHATAEAYHRERLERYHRAVLALDPKAKTITLPAGQLKARAQQPEWCFDQLPFFAWALENMPDAIRYKPAPAPEIDVNAAKKLLTRTDEKGRAVAFGVTADGDKPPGLTVEVRGDKFDIAIGNEDE